jgi:tricorn protease-like protein
VQQVGTQPWIFRVFTKTTPEGVFPQIYYISHIKLADTNAIKKENVNIRKVIGKILPGIDRDTKYVYYAAFKNMPDGSGSFEHFDMIDKPK